MIIVVVAIDHSSMEVVSGPDIISRGFVYVRESEDLMEAVKAVATNVVDNCTFKRNMDWTTLKTQFKNEIGDFIFVKTKRKPMILPVIMDV